LTKLIVLFSGNSEVVYFVSFMNMCNEAACPGHMRKTCIFIFLHGSSPGQKRVTYCPLHSNRLDESWDPRVSIPFMTLTPFLQSHFQREKLRHRKDTTILGSLTNSLVAHKTAAWVFSLIQQLLCHLLLECQATIFMLFLNSLPFHVKWSS